MTGENIKFAKKGADFFREVWRQTLCGYSTAQVADNCETTQPTVRRALKKLRFAEQKPDAQSGLMDCLYSEARTENIPTFLAWDHYIATLRQFYAGAQPIAFSKYHQCLTGCDLRLAPRKFANTHLAFIPVTGPRYTINLLQYKEGQALLDEIDTNNRCKYCPLKQYRASVFQTFSPDPYLYLTLMFTLARYRFRAMDEAELMLVHMEAAILGIVHEIVIRTAEKADLAKLPTDQAHKTIETRFLEIADSTFSHIMAGVERS